MKQIFDKWRSFKEYKHLELLDEVSFSPFNFPYENNEKFSGAGSRTQYAALERGFKVLQTVYGYINSEEKFIVKAGTIVYFTKPWKLLKGNQFGLSGKPGRGTYAYISLSSPEATSDGLINIRAVEKPAGTSQSRVAMGSAAQEQVYEIISRIATEKNILVKKVSSAPPASTKPDLVIQYGSQKIQFEIKNRKSTRGYTTIFDKSLRRGTKAPDVVETVVEAYIETIRVSIKYSLENKEKLSSPKSVLLKDGLNHVGYPHNFEGILDFYKNYVDSRYGFCSDRGDVPKSGKIPSDFITSDPKMLDVMREKIMQHLSAGGDEYFVVYTSGSKTADIFSVSEDNILEATEFPQILSAKLATYGGCSSGATRVGFKIKLSPVDSNIPDK